MSRLNFTAGNILTEADLDELARQALSNVTNATKPGSPSEGETIAVTDKDRQEMYSGSAWVRGQHWSSSGRTYAYGTNSSLGSISSGGTTEISYTMTTDPDGFYTGWDGAHYLFTVPTGCGGLYSIMAQQTFTTTWTFAGDFMGIVAGGVGFQFPVCTSTGTFVACLPCIPMAAGDTAYVYLTQVSGSSKTLSNGKVWLNRVCA